MSHVTLLVMAAGLGSRYGGDKQTDAIGPHGETLMEYSIHDAVQAGFDKVVFVIRRHMYETFRETIGRRVNGQVNVCYAFQEYDSLPEGFVPPSERTKPYGTVHAVLSAADEIHEPFAVINADDYYGRDAFAAMASYLKSMHGSEKRASMVAYELHNTISLHGTVTRGICSVDDQGHLKSVEETYKIGVAGDGSIRDFEKDERGRLLDPKAPVSTNFWGFTPWYFDAARAHLRSFLSREGLDPMKCEYVLPTLVDDMMHEDGMVVDVLHTGAVWFGMTYREDRAYVAGELKKLHDAGVYPEKL